ncbi:hypothetical protein SDJN03_14080, partial [Cucurbita argyrosperma subsp. sororia]
MWMGKRLDTAIRQGLLVCVENTGLPTFVVADAGRTQLGLLQVSAGSKNVLAIGPGPKESSDSVTGQLRSTNLEVVVSGGNLRFFSTFSAYWPIGTAIAIGSAGFYCHSCSSAAPFSSLLLQKDPQP